MTKIYIITIFLSAFLIFLIQPIMSKIILPHLGGGPSVWNISMVFYQLLLLGGYLYAHISHKLFGTKKQAAIHLILLIVSLASLPITLNLNIDIIAARQPISWLIIVLTLSIGAPFFLLSANAPLIQNWFAHTTHKSSHNPYFLYAASNLGSLIALIAYPIIIEPYMEIPNQLNSWSAIYLIFMTMITGCVYLLYNNYQKLERHNEPITRENIPTISRKLYWVILAFIPSSLMLGVTSFITSDIASIPLLWAIPLALYLLSFILTFSSKMPLYKTSVFLHIPLATAAITLIAFEWKFFLPLYAIHIILFFAVAMVCHGQLSKTKPSTRYLTEFFLWISVGGVLGGMFNSLISPLIFDTIAEYPIIILLSCFLRPKAIFKHTKYSKYLDILIPIIVFGLVIFLLEIRTYIPMNFPRQIREFEAFLFSLSYLADYNTFFIAMMLCSFAIIGFLLRNRPARLVLAMMAIMVASDIAITNNIQTLEIKRNFFGIVEVQHEPEENYNMLVHGNIIHGLQPVDDKAFNPLVYYSPLKEIFKTLDYSIKNKPVAVLGLGVGTIACHGNKNQIFDFYEINPAIEKIAYNKKYFTYLSKCPPKSNVIIGDGRLEIAKKETGRYGLIVLDAFNSDSIPIHLLTSEAIITYLDKLDNKGLIAFHVSNMNLDFLPILSSIARDLNLHALGVFADPNSVQLTFESRWVVMGRNKELMNNLTFNTGWRRLRSNDLKAWTDDYSNILQVLFGY